MSILVGISLLGLLLIALVTWQELSRPVKKRFTRWLWVVGLGLVFGFVCLRFGLGWLSVVAGGLVALFGRLVPILIRLLPFMAIFRRFFDGAKNARAADGTRGNGAGTEPFRRSHMSREEALSILGLSDGASRAEVLEAYRRVIKGAHPDRGGSSYLAAKVNEARDVLLSSGDGGRA